ncbi:MAG: phage baseplate assembly protein V [Candidatus Accumulibacter sp.]|jgi:phage baseplate assembly protein V|nr:phage baseplate assembly protein V [Accumulibacter sp.]
MESKSNLSPDLSRRLESLIRLGTIVAVDYAAALCRVESGGLTTDWLQWCERRAAPNGEGTRDWNPPTVGERCLILSPSGETGAGVAITGLYCDAATPPSNDPNKEVREWKDGARWHYDHATHEARLSVPDGGKIILTIGATTLELRGDGTTLTTPKFQGVQ